MEPRTPPQFIEGERAILDDLLIDNDALPKVLPVLRPDHFYCEAHRQIFQAMTDLFQRGEPVDWTTLTAILKDRGKLDAVGGIDYLTGLADAVPSAANIMHYCEHVREKAVRRRTITAAGRIIEDAYKEAIPLREFLDSAEQTMLSVGESNARVKATDAKSLMLSVSKLTDELRSGARTITGVPSGFKKLDRMTAGFQLSDLVIIAGHPLMGKTSLALNVATHAVEQRIPTIIFSLEMPEQQIGLRFIAVRASVNLKNLRTGALSATDWSRVTEAQGDISDLPLFLNDGPALTALELRAHARRLKREHNIGLVILDYLQLMKGPGRRENREGEISEISRSLKALAKELNVPVIALSQLNRKLEDRPDKRPRLSDLRESGAIEQDADLVIGLYQPFLYTGKDEDRGKAEAILLKQRNGPIGTVPLAWTPETATFHDAG